MCMLFCLLNIISVGWVNIVSDSVIVFRNISSIYSVMCLVGRLVISVVVLFGLICWLVWLIFFILVMILLKVVKFLWLIIRNSNVFSSSIVSIWIVSGISRWLMWWLWIGCSRCEVRFGWFLLILFMV